MSELRKDPILGRWVIIATERVKRPSDFKTVNPPPQPASCPYCAGAEDRTPPEIAVVRENGTRPNTPGWRIRVVPNKFPALRIEGDLLNRGEGIYDRMQGIGAHEVIIESPKHEISLADIPDANVLDTVDMYRARLRDLRKDPRFRYGLIFKNVGAAAGASLEHTHSQLIVTPVVPRIVNDEMEGGRKFLEYRGRCIFCDMIQQELEDRKRLVEENDHFAAIMPFAPRFPFETWILPKRHMSHYEFMPDELLPHFAAILKGVAGRLERVLNRPPYNYVVHSAPFDLQQNVEYYHWHIEIIPRLTNVAGFEWGTGFYINPVPPEDASQFMREIS